MRDACLYGEHPSKIKSKHVNRGVGRGKAYRPLCLPAGYEKGAATHSPFCFRVWEILSAPQILVYVTESKVASPSDQLNF